MTIYTLVSLKQEVVNLFGFYNLSRVMDVSYLKRDFQISNISLVNE